MTCRPGWIGTNCDEKCDPGRFGKDCLFTCNCIKDALCNHITGQCPDGCAEGYEGESCERLIATATGTMLTPAVWASIGLLIGVVVVSIIILTIVWYRTRYKPFSSASILTALDEKYPDKGNRNIKNAMILADELKMKDRVENLKRQHRYNLRGGRIHDPDAEAGAPSLKSRERKQDISEQRAIEYVQQERPAAQDSYTWVEHLSYDTLCKLSKLNRTPNKRRGRPPKIMRRKVKGEIAKMEANEGGQVADTTATDNGDADSMRTQDTARETGSATCLSYKTHRSTKTNARNTKEQKSVYGPEITTRRTAKKADEKEQKAVIHMRTFNNKMPNESPVLEKCPESPGKEPTIRVHARVGDEHYVLKKPLRQLLDEQQLCRIPLTSTTVQDNDKDHYAVYPDNAPELVICRDGRETKRYADKDDAAIRFEGENFAQRGTYDVNASATKTIDTDSN